MTRQLERAIARLRRGRRPDEPARLSRVSPAAFQMLVDERLRGLQRQLDELKGRVNGLLFLLAGTVAAQLILRLMA